MKLNLSKTFIRNVSGNLLIHQRQKLIFYWELSSRCHGRNHNTKNIHQLKYSRLTEMKISQFTTFFFLGYHHFSSNAIYPSQRFIQSTPSIFQHHQFWLTLTHKHSPLPLSVCMSPISNRPPIQKIIHILYNNEIIKSSIHIARLFWYTIIEPSFYVANNNA